ncbi:MAG: dienelactone hydrolase family protein [Chitinophagaceae bacterium]
MTLADHSILSAFMAIPSVEEVASFKGLILLQEAFGVNGHIRDLANRLADCGYAVIAPELFHRSAPGFEGSYTDFQSVIPHLQALTIEGLEADLEASYNWLQNCPEVLEDKIGRIGFCMGGRASFLANSTLPLKAAVSFYGRGIATSLLERVPNLHAPMMFFWGGRDKHIPVEQRQNLSAALNRAKKTYVQVKFGDADPGFFCNERASFHPESAAEAWDMVLTFLKNRMD